MKRYGNIYDKIIDKENIKKAHQMARKDKSHYKEVIMVDNNLDKYVDEIYEMLKNEEYYVGEEDYRVSKINDKGKVRELWKLKYYPHRIIQRAIMLQIEHIFMKNFCKHTCASVKDRGIHYALRYTKEYVRKNKYCLKIDIHHFYPNVNQEILKGMIRRKIKDKRVLKLLDIIIDSYPGGKGLPIGSYLSQYLANFYLSGLDHYIKEDLRCKYAVRYMDDIVIFNNKKSVLREILNKVNKYVTNLKMELKGNYQIIDCKDGIDFVGYRCFGDYTLLRKRTCKNMKKKVDKIDDIYYSDWCMCNSYKGWIKRCDSERLYKRVFLPIEDKLKEFYLTQIVGV